MAQQLSGADMEQLRTRIGTLKRSLDNTLAHCFITCEDNQHHSYGDAASASFFAETAAANIDADYMLSSFLEMVKKYHRNCKDSPKLGEREAQQKYEACYAQFAMALSSFLQYPDDDQRKANIDSAICQLADVVATRRKVQQLSPVF